MTLDDRKRVADKLTKIVQREYRHAHGAPSLIRHGVKLMAAQADQMGLAPEDILTDNGHDAFIAIARVLFIPRKPHDPQNRLGAEWRLVIVLAA